MGSLGFFLTAGVVLFYNFDDLGFGFSCVLVSSLGLSLVLVGSLGFSWVVHCSLGFFWVLVGSLGLSWVLLGRNPTPVIGDILGSLGFS